MSTNLRKKKFQTFQKKTKKHFASGPIFGQDRPEKNSAKSLFEAARFRVQDRHRSTKPTTASWNLNGARSLGAPTALWSVFTKRSVIGGGRRPGVWYKHIRALLCRKQAKKTPRATSRPLDHGCTWYLRGRHLYLPALPDTNRVSRGLPLCRDRRLIVAWAVFDQRVDNFQRESASNYK